MDNAIQDFTVHGKSVQGCKRHKRDIMIGFRIEGSSEFNDIFLTTEQAETLAERLKERLEQNKKE